MNVYEKEVMQKSIERIYTDFVSKVASGRKRSYESIDSIGEGHVWSGTSALKVGLVDEIGGLEAAIKGAAELAELESYSVREFPTVEDPFFRLLNQLSGNIKMSFLKKELGESYKLFREVSEIRDLSGIQVRLPYFIEIH
jgi:protease-4